MQRSGVPATIMRPFIIVGDSRNEAMANAFGFGGQNAVAVSQRYKAAA